MQAELSQIDRSTDEKHLQIKVKIGVTLDFEA